MRIIGADSMPKLAITISGIAKIAMIPKNSTNNPLANIQKGARKNTNSEKPSGMTSYFPDRFAYI
jgi:hypothetical protein